MRVSGGGDAAVYGGSGNCSHDARPPTGCPAIDSSNVFGSLEELWTKITKLRCRLGDKVLVLPGEPASRPPVIRAVYTFWFREPKLPKPATHCATVWVGSTRLG